MNVEIKFNAEGNIWFGGANQIDSMLELKGIQLTIDLNLLKVLKSHKIKHLRSTSVKMHARSFAAGYAAPRNISMYIKDSDITADYVRY